MAAILGGIGSIPGAFLGGLLIGAFEALWSTAFPIDYRDIAIFSMLAKIAKLSSPLKFRMVRSKKPT